MFSVKLFGWRLTLEQVGRLPSPERLVKLANSRPRRTNSKTSYKIALIKAFREEIGWGLKESKDYVDQLFENGQLDYPFGIKE